LVVFDDGSGTKCDILDPRGFETMVVSHPIDGVIPCGNPGGIRSIEPGNRSTGRAQFAAEPGLFFRTIGAIVIQTAKDAGSGMKGHDTIHEMRQTEREGAPGSGQKDGNRHRIGIDDPRKGSNTSLCKDVKNQFDVNYIEREYGTDGTDGGNDS